ncbi:hypothetical protein H5410_041530 [Solanum commersonii]|uniref:Uncharacterized protein n=1 Tax=Solanum commersonii TaxID=4109 RepID=A0A9J5XV08_SOLCO|nr:hypothetical protein H5410_041530 [Solanum commersonii]
MFSRTRQPSILVDWEGMIFESAVEFRKAITDYGVRQKVQLKIKPNEPHRVRVTVALKQEHEFCQLYIGVAFVLHINIFQSQLFCQLY